MLEVSSMNSSNIAQVAAIALITHFRAQGVKACKNLNNPRDNRMKITNFLNSSLPPAEQKKREKYTNKRHQCPLCYYGSNNGQDVIRHLRVHNNQKPFACDYPGCNRAYAHKSNVTSHKRTHQKT